MTRYPLGFATFASLVLFVAGCQPSKQVQTATADGNGVNQSSQLQFANLDYSSNPVEHHDADGRVRVAISTAWKDSELVVVRGIFTPDDPKYHLYSSDLPRHGVEGLGRPTLIEVVDAEVFSEIGSLVSDQATHELHEELLNVSFPVYSSGAVTLYLPLKFNTTPEVATTVSLKLTYMSCSGTKCNFPIEGAVEQITIQPPN
jgi:hypothetical protein